MAAGARKRPGYTRRERIRRADAVRAWVAENGLVCPGWQRDPHPAGDLTADHIVPPGAGGSEAGELRVLCRSCNSARGASMADRRVPGLEIVLVAGPACAGKNTYVRQHADPEDLVLDLDALNEAMNLAGPRVHIPAHLPFVCEARDAVLERLLLGGHQVRRCWVISTAPERARREHYRRRYGARVVVLWWPEETCLLRAMRERPPEWQQYVRQWFDRYEPDPKDTVLRNWQAAREEPAR
ncbi:HNH endonuclease [Streptomyces sp. JB150]|uniref:HNH endonuclease signature motif containing protein n=1 Tax=Streptomyces sp. JB150 TaxID=2714844 RepID=UPI00140B2EA3|nr:HNH endonuclease [Streptomyces sp. JB150]QIJ62560.1 HNH endonuclease [Streptomyces sp. JB150]